MNWRFVSRGRPRAEHFTQTGDPEGVQFTSAGVVYIADSEMVGALLEVGNVSAAATLITELAGAAHKSNVARGRVRPGAPRLVCAGARKGQQQLKLWVDPEWEEAHG